MLKGINPLYTLLFIEMIGNVDLSSGLSLPLLTGLFSSFFIVARPRLARGGNDRLSGGSELARAVALVRELGGTDKYLSGQ
jgi:hypothetical protein